jgi:hypothetical protein
MIRRLLMNLEENLYLVGKQIKRDAPSWGIDLDLPANEFTLWTPFPGRMAHCGSRSSLDAISSLAYQHTGLQNLYIAMARQSWIGVLKYERG